MMAVDSIRKPLLPSSVSTPKSILIKQQAGDKEAKGVSYHVSGMAKKVTFEIGVNEDNDSDGSIPWRKAGRRPPPQSTRRQRRPKRGDSSLSSQLAPPLNPSLGGTTRHLHKATGPSGIKEEVGLQAALQQQKCWNLQPQHPQTQPSSQTGMKAEEAKGNLGKIEESRDGGNDPNAARGRAQARGAVNIGTRSMSLVDAMAGSRRALGGGGGGGFGGARSRGRRIWRLQEALNKAQSEEDQAVQGLHRDTTNSLVCVSTLPLPCPTSTTVPRAGMGISQSPSPDIVPPASSALPPPTPISRSGIMVKGGRPEGVVKGHDGDITDVTSSSPLRTPASVHGPSSPPNPAKGHHAARARGSQHRRNGGLSKSNTPQAASLVKALIPISPTESGPSQTALSLVSSASILESNMSHSMSLTPTMTSVLSVPRNNTSHDGLTPGTGHVVALDYAAALPGQSAESTIPYLPNCQPCTSEVSTSYLPEPFPDPSPNTILDGKTQTPCTLKAAMRDPEVPVALTREREDSIICHLPPPSGDFLSKTEPLGRSSPPPTLSFRDYAGGVATVGVPTTAGGIVSVIKLDALSGIGGSLEGARQGEEERTGKKDEAMLPAPCLPARHPYFPSPGLDFNCGSEGPDGNGKNNSEAVVREGRGGVPLGWGMRSSTRSARRRRQEDYVKNSKFVNAFASTTTSDVTTTSSENVNLKSASPGGEQEENRGSREGEMGSTAGTLEAVTLRPSCAATAIDSTRTDSGLSISVSSSPPSGRQYVIAAEELTDGSSCVSTLTTKPGRRLKRKKLEEGRTSPITRSPRHHPQGPRRQGLRRSRRSNNGGQSRTLASSHEEACADASPSAPANEGKAEIREESASSPNPASAQEGKDADDSAQDNKVFDLNDTYDSEEVLDCDGADDPSAAAGFTAEAVTETTAAPALGDLPEASIDTSIDDTLEAASVPPTNIHEAMVAAETATTNAETPVAAPMGEGDGAVLYQVAVPVIEPVQPLYTRIRLVLGVLFQFGKGRDQDTKEDVNLDGDVEGSQSEAKVGESAITELSPTPHRKGNPSGRSLGRGRGWGRELASRRKCGQVGGNLRRKTSHLDVSQSPNQRGRGGDEEGGGQDSADQYCDYPVSKRPRLSYDVASATDNCHFCEMEKRVVSEKVDFTRVDSLEGAKGRDTSDQEEISQTYQMASHQQQGVCTKNDELEDNGYGKAPGLLPQVQMSATAIPRTTSPLVPKEKTEDKWSCTETEGKKPSWVWNWFCKTAEASTSTKEQRKLCGETPKPDAYQANRAGSASTEGSKAATTNRGTAAIRRRSGRTGNVNRRPLARKGRVGEAALLTAALSCVHPKCNAYPRFAAVGTGTGLGRGCSSSGARTRGNKRSLVATHCARHKSRGMKRCGM